jgi:hypothetical protein
VEESDRIERDDADRIATLLAAAASSQGAVQATSVSDKDGSNTEFVSSSSRIRSESGGGGSMGVGGVSASSRRISLPSAVLSLGSTTTNVSSSSLKPPPQRVVAVDKHIRFSFFKSKYDHSHATKLRKQTESILRDYESCDWAAAKQEGTGRPQDTLISMYK